MQSVRESENTMIVKTLTVRFKGDGLWLGTYPGPASPAPVHIEEMKARDKDGLTHVYKGDNIIMLFLAYNNGIFPQLAWTASESAVEDRGDICKDCAVLGQLRYEQKRNMRLKNLDQAIRQMVGEDYTFSDALDLFHLLLEEHKTTQKLRRRLNKAKTQSEKPNANSSITIRPEIAKFAEDMERWLQRDEQSFWAKCHATDLMRTLRSTIESLAEHVIFRRHPDVRFGAVHVAVAAMLLADTCEQKAKEETR